MTTATTENPRADTPALGITLPVNLLLPGGGLVLIGNGSLGTAIAVLFGAAASAALAFHYIIIDEVAPTWRGLSLGIVFGTWVGGQIRFAQNLRTRHQRTAAASRKRALANVREALARSDANRAWESLQELRDRVDDDLLVAFRFAQVLTMRGETQAAAAAWRRLRLLDRHRIYSDWIRAFDAEAAAASEEDWCGPHPPSRRV